MKSSLLRTPLLCLSLLALAACGKGKDQGPRTMPPPEVGVVRAQPQNSPLTRDLVGRLSRLSQRRRARTGARACCSSAATRKAPT